MKLTWNHAWTAPQQYWFGISQTWAMRHSRVIWWSKFCPQLTLSHPLSEAKVEKLRKHLFSWLYEGGVWLLSAPRVSAAFILHPKHFLWSHPISIPVQKNMNLTSGSCHLPWDRNPSQMLFCKNWATKPLIFVSAWILASQRQNLCSINNAICGLFSI